MNDELSKRVLGEVMSWDDHRARLEYNWLALIASMKYDGYRDFQAGMRFIESLVTWLQQFEAGERETAYSFIKRRLVYVGPGEIQHLVEQFYPKVAHDKFTRTIAERHHVSPWTVVGNSNLREDVRQLSRKTLYFGLSDGARIDILRHSNVGRINNEQVATTTQLDRAKWLDLLKDLRKSLSDSTAQFELVYLIDDFTATGTSFLRYDQSNDLWKGKLARFRDSIEDVQSEIFAPGWKLCVHHYIASYSASSSVVKTIKDSVLAFTRAGWSDIEVTFGLILPEYLPLSQTNPEDQPFLELVRKYYDPAIENDHTKVGGTVRIDLGYGGCALPLVLEHNTPNNSVALLWAESESSTLPVLPDRLMRPLFRRRQRHV